jgi:hypothetical protein
LTPGEDGYYSSDLIRKIYVYLAVSTVNNDRDPFYPFVNLITNEPIHKKSHMGILVTLVPNSVVNFYKRWGYGADMEIFSIWGVIPGTLRWDISNRLVFKIAFEILMTLTPYSGI